GRLSIEVAHAVRPRVAMIRSMAILGGAAMSSFCGGSADLPAALADLRSWTLPSRELARFFQAAILVEVEVEELGLERSGDVLRSHRGKLGEQAAAKIVGNVLGFALVE